MRWLTVTLPGQPDRAVLLERPGPPSLSDETAGQVRELISKGAAGGHLFFACDDAYKTHAELKEKGVEITEEPEDRGTASTSVSATRSATTSASPSSSRAEHVPGRRRPVVGRRHPCAGSGPRACTVTDGSDTPDRVGKGLWRSW